MDLGLEMPSILPTTPERDIHIGIAILFVNLNLN